MRIVSGTHGGRRITAPSKLPVRPTKDMAKEALFNILNNRYYFGDCVTLDLFSGTGNISYEFASRGAKQVIAVDGDQGCVRFIADTATEMEFTIQTIKNDVFTYLEKASIKADIIFADPPYDMPLEDFIKIPTLVFERKLLVEDGILVVEHAKRMDLSHIPNFMQTRKYGGSAFSFFEG